MKCKKIKDYSYLAQQFGLDEKQFSKVIRHGFIGIKKVVLMKHDLRVHGCFHLYTDKRKTIEVWKKKVKHPKPKRKF